MRYPRRRASARYAQGGAKQDFWLSFSDLMSIMVLVFILVLFYILYKYFVVQNAYKEELDKMLLIEAALSQKEEELTDAQLALESRETELTDAQKELATQQLLLNLAQQAMGDSEAELEKKQQELDAALALLTEREGALESLQSQLAEKQLELEGKQAYIIGQQAQLEGQQQQLEALVGVRTRIIETLGSTLKDQGISASVDPVSGAIMLESDVLFAYGSSELTSAGREYIDKFLPVYLSVLLSSENAEFVSEIIIEGHTDTTDTYIKNLRLSQNRAYAVAEYVLANEYPNLTSAQKNQLKLLLTANGRSYSDPIYAADGQVDAAASRRVALKFRLTDEQMIEQMRSILESEGR